MKAPRTTAELHASRMGMWDASMQRHRRFLDPNGIFDPQYTETRCCPVCASWSAARMFQKSGGTYVQCNDCSMVYLNPVLRDPCLVAYYQGNHGEQADVVENDSAFYLGLYNKGLDAAEPHIGRRARILDIGCSSGVFLSCASARGWQTTCGIELNATEAALCVRKGHSVFGGPLSDYPAGERFDAISLWDVFEHIKNAHDALEQIKGLLDPQGCLLLQIPTPDALAARVLQAQCNMFDGLEHVNLFTRAALERLAAQHRFQICHYETVIAESGVIANYLNYRDPYGGAEAVGASVLGLLTPDEICRRGLGYKAQVVLKPLP
jgi:SAM-dependent methyltransferase